MKRHILQICRDANISIVWRAGHGRSWRKQRKIRIPDVKTDITYAVALHEIGHILGRQGKGRLDKEAHAWMWAKDNAITWTPTMQAKMQRCLCSYHLWAMNRESRLLTVKGSELFNALLVEVGL